MENRKKIFGVKRNVVVFFHRLMLVAILHSSLIAPSQSMIIDGLNYHKPTHYEGGGNTIKETISNAPKANSLLLTKGKTNSSVSNKQNTLTYINEKTTFSNYYITSDIKEGVIGVSKENPLDDAGDNLFKLNITTLPTSNSRAFLSYEVNGVSDINGVARSINDRLATGGYMVKHKQGWVAQKEEIDVNWLKIGQNKIMFSIPDRANYQYSIRNLKIEFEKSELNSVLVVGSPTINYVKDGKVYVKGFVRNTNSTDIKLYIEDQLTELKNGEFEGILPLTDALKNRSFIVVKAIDSKGLLGQELITLNYLTEADKLFEIEKTNNKVSALFKANHSNSLKTEGAFVSSIDSTTLSENKEISIEKLRVIDIAPMGSGMINVTNGGYAYRFLPDGTHFEKPVVIGIGYDEKLLPAGYSTKDIKTFYFNTDSKSWVAIKRDTINENEKMISSLTTHFTDYINGIIQTPESPETAGFTPTMMNDIKAADPSAEMTIISPPEVSQKGDANVNYPIKIPAGRKGMQPQIAIQYSNEGGNGWLGQGWNIATPSIGIDTRWGTPILDPVNESEIYTMNGEQLMYPKIGEGANKVDWMPNRHYDVPTPPGSTLYNTAPRPRISNAIFTPRKQGSFAKIERLGSTPADYYWKVTGTDGTVNWYGGKEDGIVDNCLLKNAQGNIVHWGLYKTQDVHGNNVIYTYKKTTIANQTGTNANINSGIVFHIQTINYTGFGDEAGEYYVSFIDESKIERQDIGINARLGIKQVEPYRLSSIIVGMGRRNIRSYKLNYGYGKFGKSRLEDVTEYSGSNNFEGQGTPAKEFYKHTFEYYDDINQQGTDVYYSGGVIETICNDTPPPPPPCPDTDGDGVCNDVDPCPTVAGAPGGDGCPELVEKCVGFPIPSGNVYNYDYGVNINNQFNGNCSNFNTEIQSININNNIHQLSPLKIILSHDVNNDIIINLCPPIITNNWFSVKNLSFDNNLSEDLYNLPVPIYNINSNYSTAKVKRYNSVSNLQTENIIINFYSSDNFSSSIKYCRKIYQGNPLSLSTTLNEEILGTNTSIQISINSQIFINNATAALGAYDLSTPTGFSDFKTQLETSYPGTTVTNTSGVINITTTNPSLTNITVTPANSNVTHTYTFANCGTGKLDTNLVASNDWKDLKLSKEQTEYGINRWQADGHEFELPIEDVKNNMIVDFTNNGKDNTVTGTYVLVLEKDKFTWQNDKQEAIHDVALLEKLNTVYGVDIAKEYEKLNNENKAREIESRKEAQAKAKVWLEEYYKKHPEFQTKTIVAPVENKTQQLGFTKKDNNDIFSKKTANFVDSNKTISAKQDYQKFFQNAITNFSVNSQGIPTFGSDPCYATWNLDFLLPGYMPSFNSTASVLGSSKSRAFNGGFYIGIGIGNSRFTKMTTFGVQFNWGNDRSEGMTSLIDINGDGLEDIVQKSYNGNLTYKKHLKTITYGNDNQPVVHHSFSGSLPIIGITDFYRAHGRNRSTNFQISFGLKKIGGFLGWDGSRSHADNDVYFTDGNGDGLMDIVRDEVVYFNRLDGNGNPSFIADSDGSENLVITASPKETPIPSEYNIDTLTLPAFDVVKVWEAPADGNIKIDNTIALTDTSKESYVSVEMKKDTNTTNNCYSVSFTAPNTIRPLNKYNLRPLAGWHNNLYNSINNSVQGACIPAAFRIKNVTINLTPFSPTNPNLLYLANGNSSIGFQNQCPNYLPPYCSNLNFQDPLCGDFSIQSLSSNTLVKDWFINNLNSLNIPYSNLNFSNLTQNQLTSTTDPNYSYYYWTAYGYSLTFFSTEAISGHVVNEFSGDGVNWNIDNQLSNNNLISIPQGNITVGINTNVSINGVPLGQFNLIDNFTAFQTAFEAQYGTPYLITAPTANNGHTVSIKMYGSSPFLTIALTPVSNTNQSNTYNFIVSSNCGENKTAGSETIANADYSTIEPTKESKELAMNKWLAEGNQFNTPAYEIPETLVFNLNDTKDGAFKGTYVLSIKGKNYTWYDAKNELIKDKSIKDKLFELTSINLDQLIKQLESGNAEKIKKERIESQKNALAWLEEYYKKQNTINAKTSDSNTTLTYNTTNCTSTTGDLCPLLNETLSATQPTITRSITTNCTGQTLAVKKGDRIYFRVHSVANGNPPINWDPHVEYLDATLAATTDSNGLKPFNSNYSDGFVLSGYAPVGFPGNSGTAVISWDDLPVNNPTDNVTYKIIQRTFGVSSDSNTDIAPPQIGQDIVLYQHTCAANQPNIISSTGTNLNNIQITNQATNGYDNLTQTFFFFQVTSPSNVDWKNFQWKPKMVCSTPQTVQPPGGPSEGTAIVNQTFYPVPEYSTYRLYPCGPVYNKLNISSINGGTGLTITPNLNGVFGSGDTGKINFIVKRGNQFLGSRTFTITNGAIAVNSTTGISLNSSATTPSSEIEISFTADDSQFADNNSLLSKIALTSNTLATISGITPVQNVAKSNINIYQKVSPTLGSFYRQWGQFMYNPANVENAILIPGTSKYLIKEAALENSLTQSQVTDLNNDLENVNDNMSSTELEAFQANHASYLNKLSFMPAQPSRNFINNTYVDRWIGLHDENYASEFAYRAASMEQSAESLENFDPNIEQSVLETGAYAVTKYSNGNSRNFSGGINFSVVGANASTSNNGANNSLTDYIDYNGDRYPDIVTSDVIQFTNKTGGLKAATGGYGMPSESSSDSSGLGASASFGKANEDGAVSDGNGFKRFKGFKGNSGAGLSLNFTNGHSHTRKVWSDVNGDGLADLINIGGSSAIVQINTGTTILSDTTIQDLTLFDSRSKGISGGFGINKWNGSAEAGLSLTTSWNNTDNTLTDINGDGLMDLVSSNDNGLDTKINRGNQFTGSTTWSTQYNLEKESASISAALNLGISFSLIWRIWGIPFKLPTVNINGTPLSTSTNRTYKSISDFDGDGYPDLIEEVSPNSVKVYSSRIRRTDMLKTVHNPIGGEFTVDYKVQPVTYDNPNAKWVMSSLVIKDGYDKVNDGADVYRKDFEYSKGRYDRRERDFYGYETVKTIDYNVDDTNQITDVYRTSVSKYHNRSYFLNGLLKESYVYKGNDENQKYSKTINKYQVRELDDADNNIMTATALPDGFDVGGKEGRRSAAVVMVNTINELYELNASPQLSTSVSMVYDEKGRVVDYIYEGTSASTDDYHSTISYHDDQTLIDNNIISLPKTINVYGDLNTSDLKRSRATEVDVNTGNITVIKAFLNTSDFSQTDLEYDEYGNLIHITYPENHNHVRMEYIYTYDDNHHKYVIGIEDSFGYTSTAYYNELFDKIENTTDMAGNQMTYQYDVFGRNTIIRAPKEFDAEKEYTIKFTYFPKFSDLPANSGVTYDPTDLPNSTFVPVAVTQHYDAQHPDNDIETYTFIDGLARPIQIKKDIELNKDETHQNATYIEALSISGKVKYDNFGRAIEQYHPYFEEKNNTTKYRLNEYNSPNKSITVYDELDRPIKSIDPDNKVSLMEYSLEDLNGQMTIKTFSKVAQNGNQNIITETYKDASGKVIFTKNQSNQNGDLWTNFTYNSIGELQEYKDTEDKITKYTYDQLGRKIKVDHPDNGITTFTYDPANNMTELQTANLQPLGESIKYFYDYKRLVKIEYPNNPDGSPSISNVNYKYGDTGNQTGRLIYQHDATGTQEYDYGNMGEMIYNKRIIVGPTPSMPVRTFETNFSYDSWNRLTNMTYPDGEKVKYTYNLGGNLFRMEGEVNGEPYKYINRIDYDYYEQRAYLLYGNKTETYYSYSPELRRLQNLNVKTSDGNNLFNNSYKYDYVGNVIDISNSAGVTANHMAGNYGHHFKYDNLNRLTKAEGFFYGDQFQEQYNNDFNSEYNLEMKYNGTHGIERKTQKHTKNNAPYAPNSYNNQYKYIDGTHKVLSVTDDNTGTTDQFNYDLNGNIINKQSSNGNNRDLFWDESNRLRVINDNNNSLQHYIYDASGERVLKASSNAETPFQNGTIVDPTSITINGYTTYASAFLVIDAFGKYSKHYYAGSQRIVSRLGDQSTSIFEQSGGTPKQASATGETVDYKKMQQAQVDDLNAIVAKAKLGKAKFKEYKEYTYEELEKALNDDDSVPTDKNGTEAGKQTDPPALEIKPLYFYHPDHLGTSTALTDFNGKAYQFFLNLPFGETMAEQLPTSYYKTPYKFNGKEMDEETGLYYYGARYYDPKISIWLSVDPLAEMYPNFNPYNYTMQNPINLIDPTGMSSQGPGDPPKYKFQDCNCFPKSIERAPGFSFNHGMSLGPMGGENKSTSVVPLNGGPKYYTSNPFPEYFEQNHYTQIEFRLGGKNSSYEGNINIFKEKMRPLSNGFRYEAGTSIQAGAAKYFGHGSNDFNKINFSFDVAASAGVTFSVPTFDNDSHQAYPSGVHFRTTGGTYYLSGVSGSLIGRVNANIGFVSLFASAVLNTWTSFPQNTSIGTIPSNNYTSFGVFGGVGIQLKKNK